MKPGKLTGVAIGLALLGIGIAMPQGWYDTMPRAEGVALPPIKGVFLLQACFIMEGLAVLVLALAGWSYKRLEANERLEMRLPADGPGGISAPFAHACLALITLLALFLRAWHLNSGLWLDEITPLVQYLPLSPFQIFGSYISSNNHLLNTLLEKLAVTCFGEHECVARLPAMVFGVATIPAFYWVARFIFHRGPSLCAALLLAVSYHHVFFSQNARGYTAYLFFSIISAGFLARALRDDRAGDWICYVLAMVCDFAALLNSGFVFGAHVAVGGLALLLVMRKGPALPLLKRLVAVFGAVSLLGFQLYATILPSAYMYMKSVYTDASAGYASPVSSDFIHEVLRGLSSGFGNGLIVVALVFIALAGAGFLILVRRNWVVTLSLFLPSFLMAAFILVRGLIASPRFFLLALPLAVLAVVQTIESAAGLLARATRLAPRWQAWATGAVVALLAALSLVSLRNNYSVPKQDYAGAIQYTETLRKPGDIVIVIHLAEVGVRYYAERMGAGRDQPYFYVRSVKALDEVLAAHPGRRVLLITTFHRALRISFPDLLAEMNTRWKIDRTFPATIGDGQMYVWVPAAN